MLKYFFKQKLQLLFFEELGWNGGEGGVIIAKQLIYNLFIVKTIAKSRVIAAEIYEKNMYPNIQLSIKTVDCPQLSYV